METGQTALRRTLRATMGGAFADLTRTERVDAVLAWLRPIAAPTAQEAEFSRWISARNADTDQAADWCTPCARAEVARLNAAHPGHEYLVDGGWGTSTDSPPHCCKCDAVLNDHLTEYAIREEIDHYKNHSVCLRGRYAAPRAFRFAQMLESGDFLPSDPEHWQFFRKLERMHQNRVTKGMAGGAV